MTSQGPDGADEPVDLTKPSSGSPQPAAGGPEPDFDPYRFGLPDHPVPPEFAPPGYSPPQQQAPSSPYGPGSSYGPGSPYGTGPASPPGQGYPGQGAPPPGNYPPPGGYPPQGNYPLQGGYPAPGGYPQPGAPGARHNHGKAVASMVCGIASIVLCWTSYLDALLIVPAFVLGLVVLSDKRSSSRGMAVAGLICAVVGAVLATVLTVYLTHLVRECSGLDGSQLRTCVQQKV